MPTLLHLDSSADLTTSRSRAVTAALAEAFGSASPDNVVVHRDLHLHPLPHLADASLHFPPRLRPAGPAGSAPSPEAESLQQELLDELVAADVLFVGAPLYNYSLPSSLKAWIDHVHVPGVTAPFDVASQPLKGRPAVVVTSRGGSYDAGSPTEGWDHAVPVLQLILGTALGMEVTVITVDLTFAATVAALAPQIPRSEAGYAQALATAADLGSQLGTA